MHLHALSCPVSCAVRNSDRLLKGAAMEDQQAFFEENTQAQALEAFIVDVNGVLRGKKIPRENCGKLFKSGLRMPFSAYALDIFGEDVLSAGLVAETGDGDGICQPANDTLRMVPWQDGTAQVLLSMYDENGKGFFADPRHVLQNVLNLYAKKGWKPVVAAELEFYLLDSKPDEKGRPQPPVNPRTGKRSADSHLFSLSEMQDFSAVLDEIPHACALQGIPADTAISENGPGQYEINLFHVPDALAAADHAVLMKRAIRGVARKHGMDATFMAKPFAGLSGNGLHVHFSILDKSGMNIFTGRDKKGSPLLRHAIGGVLKSMEDCTAIFAPNFNSYRRFAPGSHAPTTVSWGYDNRSAAIRVPDSDRDATRIEHRVAGADANPYLLLAAMLAGAYDGMVGKKDPGKPFTGNVYKSNARHLPREWGAALDRFEKSAFVAKYFGKRYQKVYAACKRQELEIMQGQVSSIEYDAYMRDI